NDWYSPWNIPTLHNTDICHTTPKIDTQLTDRLKELIPEAPCCTYLQTNGPRFETTAEIARFAKAADIVGMTIASELTLAAELNIPAAALCTIDNYATGICSHETTYDEVIAAAQQNGTKITNLITKIIETLA
ncbi:MAG TPA: 5'-methylthioadenosine phosphorylase, partial [Methanocorpusculum sp.]|nr:5'-methylthioadenosine phosphorylase [Methanocorpusculum sp.]